MSSQMKKYSGFGIETQAERLKIYVERLMRYKEDIRTEFNSLVRIVDIINESEEKAKGILGGKNISEEYKLDGYETVGNVEKSTSGKFSEMFRDVYDLFTDIGKNAVDFFSSLFDSFKNTPDSIKIFFNDLLGSSFDVLASVGKVMEIIDFFADGTISFSDIAGTFSNSESVIESVLKITEAVSDYKFIPSATTAVKDTVMIGGKYVGKFTQYLPVAGVIFDTIYSGAKTYDRVSADGKVNKKDWGEIGFDAGMDGLIACGEALICIACPPAAIGVAIFEIGNIVVDLTTGTSIKDMAKDGLKKGVEILYEKYNELMGRAVPA
ncbi:MAG: hypothetical protein NC078_03845 [Ruminococcus sp.]|nr:hypothetical protein [Ruminococcus sp.]